MRVVLFCHSLLSDWNHGNAHFLRGVVTDLQARGHDVRVYEPRNAWSVTNLVADAGQAALEDVRAFYPDLHPVRYDEATLDVNEAVDGADLVLVHEWNSPTLVEAIGRHHARGGHYVLLFHDTHHRSVSAPHEMAQYDLSAYDGVLAFGEVIRERYVKAGWARRAWTWHEAADVRLFRPVLPAEAGSHTQKPGDLPAEVGSYTQKPRDLPAEAGSRSRICRAASGLSRKDRKDLDLVWIGNWGDDERSQEIREYLIEPVRQLQLRARVHGVRYPDDAKQALMAAGIEYAGWLANYRVPEAFAGASVTVHVPRRPYVEALPGIPTIRMFEALACGIPLVSCWWHDSEGLFRADRDYLSVRTPAAMVRALHEILHDHERAAALSRSGRETILARHSCARRVDELLGIASEVSSQPLGRALTV